MNEFLDCPQAVRVIPHILAKGSLNMREFIFLGKMSEKKGKQVRDQMEKAWGLITVTEPEERTTNDIAIRLTREGEEVARILKSIDPVLETGKRKTRGSGRA